MMQLYLCAPNEADYPTFFYILSAISTITFWPAFGGPVISALQVFGNQSQNVRLITPVRLHQNNETFMTLPHHKAIKTFRSFHTDYAQQIR
jgi:hypothetical protein